MAEEQPGRVLVVHTGELDDICDVLADAGLPFEEARPGPEAKADTGPLCISSPPFLLDGLKRGGWGSNQRMVILEGESRTARSMLARGGIEWMVRRPVHPAALRLLVLHCLYNGPEKRKTRRVTIGAPVSFRNGWRAHTGILEELSVRDCRILSQRKIAIGQRVKLRLPQEIAGRKPLRLEGRVVRVASAPGAEDEKDVCLVFDPPASGDMARLGEIVRAHERGPAVLRGEARDAQRDRAQRIRRTVISVEGLERPEEPAAAEAVTHVEDPLRPERRGEPRHPFGRRIIAMGEAATRVLVGRDISLGGMRVDPTRALRLGEQFQIAVHIPGQETPLVLRAEVTRDDGEHGLLLNFRDLSPTAKAYLEEVLANLPGLASGDGDSSTGEAPRVVSEILEQRAG